MFKQAVDLITRYYKPGRPGD